ncbi:MAG: alpha-amylase family glycosyl hydrolase [Gemmatimonadota bacterium]|nr:alpha-amylase family glycosyl hydrolase [Gemmatimonadota bacterium]
MSSLEPALIYNLFPTLAGPFTGWRPHLERAATMGFNWIFVNPVTTPGLSGSLYAVKDYFSLNERLVDSSSGDSPRSQLESMLETAHGLGLKVMLDLVINHTAIDSPLVTEHPEWYKRDKKGRIRHPGVKEEGKKKKTVWGDLAQIDNSCLDGSNTREALRQYWWRVTRYYLELGFDGFRCDAAYKVPDALWEFLIGRAVEKFPGTLFFAESLGCTVDKVVALAGAGFDYVFNSSKYWDFKEPWCLTQYEESRALAPSVSFPESHDTLRLFRELKGNPDAVRQRYLFAALFSTGVMIPVGFEFGFEKKLHVVRTTPEDWEQTGVDLCSFINRANRYKLERPIFCHESPTFRFDLHPGTGDVTGLIKVESEAGPSALMLINRDPDTPQPVMIENIGHCLPGTSQVVLEHPGLGHAAEPLVPGRFERLLEPAALIVLRRDR